MSSLNRQLLSKGLPPLRSQPMSTSRSRFQRTPKDFTVLPWTDYFDRSEMVQCNGNEFNVYIKGDTGPIVVFLHGGGFSGLSWSLLTQLLGESVDCICFAIDLRGHGSTKTSNDHQLDMETLTSDVCDVITTWNSEKKSCVLVGHSLGGAIAVNAAITLQERQQLLGLVVLDVVEGTALESLRSMRMILIGRPKKFKNIETANEWCTKSGYIRNLSSARVSMIGQLVKIEKEKADNETPVTEDESSSSDRESSSEYEWKIDLMKTEQHWRGWFEGLSAKFLSISAPKLLLLAGVDRLDRDLTVGQMQGKFQMKVLPKSGHAIHEDAPKQVAETLEQFFTRHKMVEKR